MKTAFEEMIALRRSVRRFKQEPVDRAALLALVRAARLHPSGANKQPLVFVAVDDPRLVAGINGQLKFAGYLPPEQKPTPEEGPMAHVVIGIRKDLASPATPFDVGAAAMTLLLGACAHQLGACWLHTFNRPKVEQLLGLGEDVEAQAVIALGYPAEAPKEVPMSGDDIKYWLDDNKVLNVPKRPEEETLFLNGYNKGWS